MYVTEIKEKQIFERIRWQTQQIHSSKQEIIKKVRKDSHFMAVFSYLT